MKQRFPRVRLLTTQLQDPISRGATRDVLIVDVAGEQRRVDRAEVERSSWLERLRVRDVHETRQLEGHEGRFKGPVAVRKVLPEWRRARRRDG